jgi:hypothetical protein
LGEGEKEGAEKFERIQFLGEDFAAKPKKQPRQIYFGCGLGNIQSRTVNPVKEFPRI